MSGLRGPSALATAIAAELHGAAGLPPSIPDGITKGLSAAPVTPIHGGDCTCTVFSGRLVMMADGDVQIHTPRTRAPSLRARTAAAVAGVKAGGESVRAVDVHPDGVIRVFTGEPEIDLPSNDADDLVALAGKKAIPRA